jgi:hypothetical protein
MFLNFVCSIVVLLHEGPRELKFQVLVHFSFPSFCSSLHGAVRIQTTQCHVLGCLVNDEFENISETKWF